MCRAHMKHFVQFGVRSDRGKIIRQRLVQLIINRAVHVTPCSRDPDDQVSYKDQFIVFCDKCRNPLELRQNRPVFCLVDRFIKYKYERRKDRYASDYSEKDALGHNNSDVHAQRKAHETQCNEACYSRDGGADD